MKQTLQYVSICYCALLNPSAAGMAYFSRPKPARKLLQTNQGVVSLSPEVSFLFLEVVYSFKIHKSCSFVKVISVDKTCKYQTFVDHKAYFCNNSKACGQIILGFCRGNQFDTNFWVGLQKYHCSTNNNNNLVSN